MPSTGTTRAAQARLRRQRAAAEQAAAVSERDDLRSEVERLTSAVADRDAEIERLTAAGSCGQCRRLATLMERQLVAEKQAHATTRTDLEARLKQRDARIGELEWLVPPWAWL